MYWIKAGKAQISNQEGGIGDEAIDHNTGAQLKEAEHLASLIKNIHKFSSDACYYRNIMDRYEQQHELNNICSILDGRQAFIQLGVNSQQLWTDLTWSENTNNAHSWIPTVPS